LENQHRHASSEVDLMMIAAASELVSPDIDFEDPPDLNSRLQAAI